MRKLAFIVFFWTLQPGVLRADIDIVENSQILVRIHAGQESREELNWSGASIGCYFHALSDQAMLPKVFLEWLRQSENDASIEFTAARIKKFDLDKDRNDYSIIPKLYRFYGSSFYMTGGIGIGYDELDEGRRKGRRLALGGNLFFAPEIGVGFQQMDRQVATFLEATFTHRSNANLGDDNHGLNFFLVTLGFRF